jgi:FkbM family methyltransferase
MKEETGIIRSTIHQFGLNKIVAFQKILDFVIGTLRSATIPFPSYIQGFWIKGPPLMDIICRAYEPRTTYYVKKLTIKPGFNFVDVGADYGYYSLLIAKLSHDKANVYAFEPSINRYDQYLIPNINRNHYHGIRTYKKALSNTNKPATFHLESGSLYNIKDETRTEIVECDLLDNIIPKDVIIDLVKIDVEGAEINVLKGMERIITDSYDIKLIIEVHPGVQAKAGHNFGEVTDYLFSRGFGVYCIQRDGSLSRFKDTAELLDYVIPRKYINVVFKRDGVEKLI